MYSYIHIYTYIFVVFFSPLLPSRLRIERDATSVMNSAPHGQPRSSEERATSNVEMTFTSKSMPESGLDSLMCATLAVQRPSVFLFESKKVLCINVV